MAKGPPRSHASPPKGRVVDKQLPGQAITQLPLHLGGSTWHVLECGGICLHVCHSVCLGASPPSLLSGWIWCQGDLGSCPHSPGSLWEYAKQSFSSPGIRMAKNVCIDKGRVIMLWHFKSKNKQHNVYTTHPGTTETISQAPGIVPVREIHHLNPVLTLHPHASSSS